MTLRVLCSLLLSFGFAQWLPAQDCDGPIPYGTGEAFLVVATNDTGTRVRCLQANFDGGGSCLYVNPETVFAPNCPVPTVPTNPPDSNGQEVLIDWGLACLNDGSSTAFILQSESGPVTFLEGYWCDAFGDPVGDITNVQVIPIPQTAFCLPGTQAILKIETVAVPQGPTTYGDLKPPAGPGMCWSRTCMVPITYCFARVKLCCLAPGAGIVTCDGCVVILPWTLIEVKPAMDVCVRVTNPRQLDLPIPDLAPIDHFPNVPDPASNHPWGYGETIVASDPGGDLRTSANFASTFLAMTELFLVTGADPDVSTPFDELLGLMGPGYLEAAGLVADLTTAIEEVATFDTGSPVLDFIDPLVQVNESLNEMGEMFVDQEVTSPDPFYNAEEAFSNLSEALQAYPDAPPHLLQAASHLEVIIRGFQVSAEMAEGGFADPCEQDFFLWGLNNRFEVNIGLFGAAMRPHVRVQLDLQNYAWYPNTIQGTRVLVQDPESFTIESTWVVNISDNYEIAVPAEGGNRSLWIKLPAHLSQRIEVETGSGQLYTTSTLIAGDVDGDDDVDMGDFMQTYNTLGAGNRTGPFVPSTDVNADGIVDVWDLITVYFNLGQVGAALAPNGLVPADTSPFLPVLETDQ